MEVEYKWEMPSEEERAKLLAMLCEKGQLSSPHELRMHACYYDTPDRYVQRMRGGLRRRFENDASVCCLKLAVEGDDGYKARREFEVESDDIRSGIELLKEAGAPVDVCDELLARELLPLCETDFIREELDFNDSEFEAKLAFDAGHMSRQERQAPISEMEFEYVSGDEAAFHEHARSMERILDLVVQPKSKLARAASL